MIMCCMCVCVYRTDSERVLHQRIHAVPFNLTGPGEAASVRVLCPLEASSLTMEIIHEKFHQATYGFSDLIGQYLSGEKPKGQLETEEMLKVGSGSVVSCLDMMKSFRFDTRETLDTGHFYVGLMNEQVGVTRLAHGHPTADRHWGSNPEPFQLGGRSNALNASPHCFLNCQLSNARLGSHK